MQSDAVRRSAMSGPAFFAHAPHRLSLSSRTTTPAVDWQLHGHQHHQRHLHATPHGAGVGALYLHSFPACTPVQVTTAIKSLATPNTINLHAHSAHYGTPNLFLFTKY
jgi:hypothetical protein